MNKRKKKQKKLTLDLINNNDKPKTLKRPVSATYLGLGQ